MHGAPDAAAPGLEQCVPAVMAPHSRRSVPTQYHTPALMANLLCSPRHKALCVMVSLHCSVHIRGCC